MWLWAKYVTGVNLNYHCTNSLKGPYSKNFSKHNENFNSNEIVNFDEISDFKAIYICGVSNVGYSKKENYPRNLHLVLIPKENHKENYSFLDWNFKIENTTVSPIISEAELPEKYSNLPPEFTTCRIFRWACSFNNKKNVI
jgi:hypothetical protein